MGRLRPKTLLVFGLGAASFFAYSSGWEEPVLIRQIEHQYGKVLNPKEASGLYETVETVFRHLTEAQNELLSNEYLAVNKIFVVDSPIENALVSPLKDAATHKLTNRVFITTGLLQKMTQDAAGQIVTDSEGAKKGIARIAGILAHELAHPLDHVDSHGFENRQQGPVYSQAMEIRADAEAVAILRKAGYPAESVYWGLDKLFEKSGSSSRKADDTAVKAALSTHPHDDVRLSAQRTFLTLDRYRHGAVQPKYPGTVKTGFLRELSNLKRKTLEQWSFKPSQNLMETLKRIESLPSAGGTDAQKQLQYNHLIREMDQKLLSLGTDTLDAADEEQLRKIILAHGNVHWRSDYKTLLNHDELKAEFSYLPESVLPRGRSHHDLIEKIPYFRRPEHVAWVKSQSWERPINRVTYGFLPAEQFVASYGDDIVARVWDSKYGFFDYEKMPDLQGLKPEVQARMANHIHTHLMPKLSMWEKAAAVAGMNTGSTLVVPKIGIRSSNQLDGLTTNRFKLLNPAKSAELNALRSAYQRIWDERGYWGVVDFLMEGNIAWEHIWEVLEIPPAQGRSQLLSGVKKFTRSQDYVTFLREFRDPRTGNGIPSHISQLLGSHPGGGNLPLTWADDTLLPYLRGDLNEHLAKVVKEEELVLPVIRRRDSVITLTDVARRPTSAYLQGRPQVLIEPYEKVFRAELKKRLLEPKWGRPFEEAHDVARKEIKYEGILEDSLTGSHSTTHMNFNSLMALDIPNEIKKAALAERFAESVPSWITQRTDNLDKKVVQALIDAKLADSPTELLLKYQKWALAGKHNKGDIFSNPKSHYGGYGHSSQHAEVWKYFTTLKRFSKEIAADLENNVASDLPLPQKKKRLFEIAGALLDPGQGVYSLNEPAKTKAIRDLKGSILAEASKLALKTDEKQRLFEHLVATGATPLTDAYLKAEFPEYFGGQMNQKSYKWLDRVLSKESLYGHELKLSLAKKILQGDIRSLRHKTSLQLGDVDQLIKKLNAFVPEGSVAKDAFLEEVAWQLNLEGKALVTFIEDQKSYNWKKVNPLLANMGSSISARLSKLNADARQKFLSYLIDPQGSEMPDEIFHELKTVFKNEVLENIPRGEMTEIHFKALAEAEAQAELARAKLEQLLVDSTPYERIPLIEMILANGEDNLAKRHDYPFNLTRTYLKYKPDSVEEKLLISFLNVIPKHEKGVTLAYLLSQSGQNKSSVKNLFEVFQTVGIKFGQMSSIWKLFGDEIAQETASLKDHAPALPKHEVEKILKASLSLEEQGKIKKLVRVLGSASLKTVVEVELVDGSHVVALVQNPDAAHQIESNLKLAEEFLTEVKRNGVPVPTGLFDALIEDLRFQLREELKMTQELAALEEARTHYHEANKKFAGSLNGYKFVVPSRVEGFKPRDNVLFLEKGTGVSWDALPESIRNITGKPIVESSLDQLYRRGIFDADRHGANFLINEKTKEIFVLDLGQWTRFDQAPFWKEDDISLFSRFTKAVAEGNPDDLAEIGAKMAGRPQLSSSELSALRSRIQTMMHSAVSDAPGHLIVDLVNTYADAGFRLDRKFTVGAIKGLRTLQGQEYVTSAEFERILRRSVTEALIKKSPGRMAEALRGICGNHLRSLFSNGPR